MPTIDKASILARLNEQLALYHNDVTRESTDLLSLALAGKNLSEVNIITVPSKDTLPNLYDGSYPDGMLYFIVDTGIFAISVGTSWKTLDGRLLRTDLSENRLWSWGCGSQVSLGDNTTTDKSSPVSVVGGFTDWCQVSTRWYHSLALRTNGTLWAWGIGSLGRLGDGTTVNKSSPVSVVGGFTDWCQVSANCGHSLGLRTNGTAWAWGNNGSSGSLGDNSTTDKSSPVSVAGEFTDWCQVTAGRIFSLGLRTNGTLWAWGNNANGQLGDNTTVNKSSPVSVVGGFTDWCQVSAAFSHTIALRTNGTLWGWGCNSFGQIGDNTTVNKSSPVSVVGGFTDWCQVSAGSANLGIRTNGTLWAWSTAIAGRLGDGTTVNKSSPVSVVGGFTDWCQVDASAHSLGVRTNGTAWAWGCDSAGQLGDNDTINKSSPVSVVGGFTDWCQVAGGICQSLGITKRQ